MYIQVDGTVEKYSVTPESDCMKGNTDNDGTGGKTLS